MKIKLKELKANPFRDLQVDPIDIERVKILQQSIEEDGFWGGVVCRPVGDEIQIVAGHHRIHAAIAAGITEADLLVKDLGDEAAVRIYSRENATHRGNNGTAQIGSVAAALRWVARSQTMSGVNYPGQIADGIGRRVILDLLKSVPGISDNSVEAQLANLKTSGAYARILGEVATEIELEFQEAQREARQRAWEAEEAERKAQAQKDAKKKQEAEAASQRAAQASQKAAQEAKEAQERAEKAKTAKGKAAEKHRRTFDLESAQKFFKNDSQLNAFRNGIISYLVPLKRQFAIAQQIVDAVGTGRLSADFITQKLKEILDPPKPKELPNAEEHIKGLIRYHTAFGYDFLGKCSALTSMTVLPHIPWELREQLANHLEQLLNAAQRDAKQIVEMLRLGAPKMKVVTSTRKRLEDGDGEKKTGQD